MHIYFHIVGGIHQGKFLEVTLLGHKVSTHVALLDVPNFPTEGSHSSRFHWQHGKVCFTTASPTKYVVILFTFYQSGRCLGVDLS